MSRRRPAAASDDLIRIADGEIVGRTGHRIPVRDYSPVGGAAVRPFFWVHGGGFMTGGLDMQESDAVARAVARSGRSVRTVDYRLVPMVNFRGRLKLKPSNNRYPAPLHDVMDAYLDLAAADRTRAPVLGGASAGANLALSAALLLRDGEGTPPAGLLLAYGTFHGHPAPMSDELRSRFRASDRLLQVLLGPDSLERMNINYAGSVEYLDDPAVFPGGSDLQNLPPVFVLNADRDGLRASGDALIEELRASGNELESTTLAGSSHGFLNKPETDYFSSGVQRILRWLDGCR